MAQATKALTPAQQERLLKTYVSKIQPLLEDAKKAVGSRSIDSPQHKASREYTKLLVAYADRNGSLPQIARALGVTYPGVRRRVITAPLEASAHRKRLKFTDKQIAQAVERVSKAKLTGDTHKYHTAIFNEYGRGHSLGKIATGLGLSSANPLYYGLAQIRLERDRKAALEAQTDV